MSKKIQLFFIPLLCILLVTGCGGGQEDVSTGQGPDPDEGFVRATCSGCHEFVPAEMLNKETWATTLLPAMAVRMGVFTYHGQNLLETNKVPGTEELLPKKPLITEKEMERVFAYYERNAPAIAAPQMRSILPEAETPVFRMKYPDMQPMKMALTTFVKIQPGEKALYAGVSGMQNVWARFDQQLRNTNLQSTPSAPSWIDHSGTNMLVTSMGPIYPTNASEGVIEEYSLKGPLRKLAGNQPRPVQSQWADLNGDGNRDILVNGFGHMTGKLYWLDGGNPGKEHVIRPEPGAIHSKVTDWDKDGRQDILTLFTQGKEGVYLFRNAGGGKFEEKLLIGFSPVFGSSSFELADMNKDGRMDIVYTCGDNADFSVILKGYHGVYIFLQDEKGAFAQKWFYPVHGSYKSLARDFDGDGDLDMIAISFFADYITQPTEALLYFENKGDLNFVPFKVNGFGAGRWLTMDAGDLDGDGDEDVVLGNFSNGPNSFMPEGLAELWQSAPPFIFLENQSQ